MPSVALTTLGCKVNQFETETMAGLFQARGYEVVPFTEVADFYVINTCSVTAEGERKSRQLIRRAHKENPQSIVAVVGCYAQIAPQEIQNLAGVHVVIGTKGRAQIVDLMERAAQKHAILNAVTNSRVQQPFEDIPILTVPGRTRAFLKIEEGCSNFCSYCIIPYARGPVRSRNLESVQREAAKLDAMGFQEIVLTGIHLGLYGSDFAMKACLADAVRATLQAAPHVHRVRLSSLESVEFSAGLMQLLQTEPRFAKHLHLPLQSGSDKILTAMNRHYTTADFARLVQMAREAAPQIAISTDIIVGFPGETEADFNASLAFAEHMQFSRMHVFPYSKRVGTMAAEMQGQVDESEKKARVARMRALADRMADDFRERFIGQEAEVLFETAKDGLSNGHTETYLRVYTDVPIPSGTLCKMHFVKLYRDGLWGMPV